MGARTIVGLNDPKAVKKWSTALASQSLGQSYWGARMVGKAGSSMPIHIITDLEAGAGDKISFDLSARLSGYGSEGDDPVGSQSLAFYTDKLEIDQYRPKSVNTGGRMTQKRTLHNLRTIAKDRLAEYWSEFFDEQYQIYLSGARGVAGGLITPLDFTGRANNPLLPPDAEHIVYGGAAVSKATLASTDEMTIGLVDALVAKAGTMDEENRDVSAIKPIMIEGEEHFVLQMHPWQEHALRKATGAGSWLDIQKAAATALGNKSPIFKGGLGMYNNVVLHKHKRVIRFSDYGAGSNVKAARALFLGEQAGVVAYGSATNGDTRFSWYEETVNKGNDVEVTTNCIFGTSKTRFNGMDYGVVAVDTAINKPTVA